VEQLAEVNRLAASYGLSTKRIKVIDIFIIVCSIALVHGIFLVINMSGLHQINNVEVQNWMRTEC
jgi:hypothetical protein